MKIRFAEARDIPGILNLLCQVGKIHHDLRPDIFQPDARKYGPSQLLDMLKNPDTPIFVAVEADTLLGYGFCKVKNITRIRFLRIAPNYMWMIFAWRKHSAEKGSVQ